MMLNEGDIFLIPLENGEEMKCKIICAFKGKFKKVFSFVVLKCCYEDYEELFSFRGYKNEFNVIFSSVEKIKKKEWKVVDNRALDDFQKTLQYYEVGGHLYHNDEYIRRLNNEEVGDYISMKIAGFDLIKKYFEQIC